MIFKKINKDGKWLTYKSDFEVKVKPFDLLEEYGENTDFALEQFMQSIVIWRGLKGEDGKPTKCDNKNKLYAYKYDIQFRIWVLKESEKLGAVFEEEVKNLEPSQNGNTPKES